MKWFSLTLALVCLFALQSKLEISLFWLNWRTKFNFSNVFFRNEVVIEAKPVDEDEAAAASATAVDESETPEESNDDTPAESNDDTPAESNDDAPAESNDDAPAEPKDVITAPTKKPWNLVDCKCLKQKQLFFSKKPIKF